MTYKPEIDGLRAVAVLLVLLCHMQLSASGGFIGVDVFFVISGFLITSILIGGISEGRFSFWNFYGRRFIRLYPALIAVTVLVFAAAFLLLSPSYMELIARTAKYAITSTSNVFFSKFQGYFDASAQAQPFLHTWSLGVEWQFYLIWPLLVWGIYKLPVQAPRKWLVAALALITLASVIASQWMIGKNANTAYYQMPFRAFELGIGALLVFVYPKRSNPAVSAGLTLAGMAAILYAAFVYTPATPFPGLAALPPCLGAAACIYGAQGFTTGNVLKWPWVVYIGKISYSVYLVHWPLLVLYRLYIFREINTTEKAGLFIASLVLGALLYSCIETRINWKRLSSKLAGSLATLAVVGVCLGLFQYASRIDSGLPWRLSSGELNTPLYTRWGGFNIFKQPLQGQADAPQVAVIAGDSFAASLAHGIDNDLKARHQSAELMFSPACVISPTSSNEHCKTVSLRAFQQARETHLPLVLVMSWGVPYSEHFLLSHGIPQETQAQYHQELYGQLDQIQQLIGDSPLILVGNVPYKRWGMGAQECLLRPQYVYRACEQQIGDYRVNDLPTYQTNQALSQYAQTRDNVYYIDIDNAVCPQGVCTTQRSAMMYYDGFHLSVYGSDIVGPYVMQQITNIIEQYRQANNHH